MDQVVHSSVGDFSAVQGDQRELVHSQRRNNTQASEEGVTDAVFAKAGKALHFPTELLKPNICDGRVRDVNMS